MQEPTPSLPDSPGVPAAESPMTWARTRFLIRSDFERLAAWYGGGSFSKRAFWFFQPNFQALFLYRLYHFLFVKGWRNTSRLLFLYALYLTGVEISPSTIIGPSCLIAHAFGIILFGKIGARCSLLGQCGTGGGLSLNDIGGGPGYPVVGDDVVFGAKAMVLGPVRIGHRVKLGPAVFVNRDMPDDVTALSMPAKIVRNRASTGTAVNTAAGAGEAGNSGSAAGPTTAADSPAEPRRPESAA